MGTIKKTTVSKITTVAPKAATQKIVAPVAAAPKAAVKVAAVSPVLAATQPIKPVAAKKDSAPTKTISKGEWNAMVEQAAYYIAEKNGFSGEAESHWSEAEAQIQNSLKVRGIKVA